MNMQNANLLLRSTANSSDKLVSTFSNNANYTKQTRYVNKIVECRNRMYLNLTPLVSWKCWTKSCLFLLINCHQKVNNLYRYQNEIAVGTVRFTFKRIRSGRLNVKFYKVGKVQNVDNSSQKKNRSRAYLVSHPLTYGHMDYFYCFFYSARYAFNLTNEYSKTNCAIFVKFLSYE